MCHLEFIHSFDQSCLNSHLVFPALKISLHKEGFEPTKSGWMDPSSGVEITFAQLFKDLRTAIDDIHLTSLKLKKAVIENPKR